MTDTERIAALEKRVAELEAMIAAMSGRMPVYVPVYVPPAAPLPPMQPTMPYQPPTWNPAIHEPVTLTTEGAIALAVEAERERCAKIAEEVASFFGGDPVGKRIAAAIRDGEQPCATGRE